MLSNYLVLTPDGVGSTYLQRALCVYLNSAGLDYWNTHELLNGLGLYQGNLCKKFELHHSQTVSEICDLITSTKNNLVSRIAQYHITGRLKKRKENYQNLYDTCNTKFDKIFYCTRDPFEYALSWSIRQKTNTLNVYSVEERNQIHGEEIKHIIDLNFFKNKLKKYSDYEYWAEDNFNITRTVGYNDMHHSVDAMMKELTGLDHNVKDRFEISLQDYSTFRYNSSLYTQNRNPQCIPSKGINLAGKLALHKFIDKIDYAENKMPDGFPIKMNTLQDKQNRIKNFEDSVDTYNKWTTTTNSHTSISQQDIDERIITESKIYEI